MAALVVDDPVRRTPEVGVGDEAGAQTVAEFYGRVEWARAAARWTSTFTDDGFIA